MHWRNMVVEAQATLLKADAVQEQGQGTVRVRIDIFQASFSL